MRSMAVFRRSRLPLVVAVTSLAVLALMAAVTFLGTGGKGTYDVAPSSNVLRDGRAEDPEDGRRDREHLDAEWGIIPSAFFAVPTVAHPRLAVEGDTPHKDINWNNKVEGVSSNEARPKLEAMPSGFEPKRSSDSNKKLQLVVHPSETDRPTKAQESIFAKQFLSKTLKNPDSSQPARLPSSSSSTLSPQSATVSSRQTPAPTLPSFHPSKELFIRVVHFDDRPRDGHQNTSVFLVVALKFITDNKLIVGCQIDHHEATDFRYELIGETPLWRAFYNHINHEELMVYCYDLPATSDSVGYITYSTEVNSTVTKMAASERRVKFPAPRIPPTSREGKKYNLTIVACAKIFNKPPWLGEWITYQRTIGVDHIHFDAEDTFQKYGYIRDPTLQAAIKSGYVSVEIWNGYLNGNELWYHNQGLIYEDCGYRFRNTYDYIVTVDTDDFFTPRVLGEGKIHYYINKYCREKTTGSCKFKWIEFFPDYYGFNNLTASDGNITRRLSNYSHYIQGNPKSLHRTNVLLDTATHYAYRMVSGYQILQVSPDVAYFAHVRKRKDPPAIGKGLRLGVPHSAACLEHVLSRTLLVLVLLINFLLSIIYK